MLIDMKTHLLSSDKTEWLYIVPRQFNDLM